MNNIGRNIRYKNWVYLLIKHKFKKWVIGVILESPTQNGIMTMLLIASKLLAREKESRVNQS